MKISLRPEIEKIVEQDVRRGSYQSADEFVERAITQLHEQEEWLAGNRGEIEAKIEEGWAAAERGELLDPDSLLRDLDEHKKIRMEHRREK